MVFVENDFESRNEMFIRFEEEILSIPNHTKFIWRLSNTTYPDLI